MRGLGPTGAIERAVFKSSSNTRRACARLPRLRAFAFNCDSLSAYTTTPDGARRRRRVIQRIRQMLSRRDVGLIQETQLGRHDDFTLGKEFPEFDIYRSNHELHSAGVLTFVRKTFATRYVVEVVPSGEASRGRVLVLSFRSKAFPGDNRAHFDLANVYFSSGQRDMVGKAAQIDALNCMNPAVRSVIGGDFNFVENSADCSGSFSSACLTGEAQLAWTTLKEKYSLRDIAQEAHTRFGRGAKRPSSSRLDRFYTSTSEAEASIVAQHTYPVPIGSFWCRDQASLHARLSEGELVPLILGLSDHIPLALDMVPKKAGRHGEPDTPAWAENVEGFGEAVDREFGTQDLSAPGFAELDR